MSALSWPEAQPSFTDGTVSLGSGESMLEIFESCQDSLMHHAIPSRCPI